MVLSLNVLAQTDATGQRVQLIVFGLLSVAAALALATAWYWRVTDPKLRSDPQPSAPTRNDQFVAVERAVKPQVAEPESADSGPMDPPGGVYTELPPMSSVDGYVDLSDEPQAAAPEDLELSPPPPNPVQPSPPRPTPAQVIPAQPTAVSPERHRADRLPARPGRGRSAPARIDLPAATIDLTDTPKRSLPEQVTADIDLRPSAEPEPSQDTQDGLSVDEWLALKGD